LSPGPFFVGVASLRRGGLVAVLGRTVRAPSGLLRFGAGFPAACETLVSSPTGPVIDTGPFRRHPVARRGPPF